jgi:hypothetical protein
LSHLKSFMGATLRAAMAAVERRWRAVSCLKSYKTWEMDLVCTEMDGGDDMRRFDRNAGTGGAPASGRP